LDPGALFGADLNGRIMMAKSPETESILDMFSRLGSELKLPKVDVEAVLSHHRKNLEALEKSAKAAATGASSVMAKQREALQQTLNEFSGMAQNFKVPGDAQEFVTNQAEFARKSFEAAVKNAGDVAEIVRQSGSESVDILRQRIREAMDEVRESFEKRN
jgi:phasin family protein